MQKVRVGLIGSGFSANFHAHNYRLIHGVDFELLAVTAAEPIQTLRAFAERHAIPRVYESVDELLADPEINLVDICVPNLYHVPLAIRAAQTGRNVICEKPLTGYHGTEGDSAEELIGFTVPKRAMVEVVMAAVDELERAVADAGVKFMYAENWIYAPPITKAQSCGCAARSLTAGPTLSILTSGERLAAAPSSERGATPWGRRFF
jgi:hypothetical protein